MLMSNELLVERARIWGQVCIDKTNLGWEPAKAQVAANSAANAFDESFKTLEKK